MVFLSAGIRLQGAGNNLPQLRVQLAASEKAEDEAAVVELSRHILEITPNDSGLWEKRARKQLKLKDYDRCDATLNLWEKAVRPRPAVIEDLRGDVAYEQDGFKKAEQQSLVEKLEAVPVMTLTKNDMEKLRPEDRPLVEQMVEKTQQGF